jgi:magnesium chelatase family protein
MAYNIPDFNIVVLPDETVAESKECIRAALNSNILLLPSKRITVNPTPADLLKKGSCSDLAVAVGLLVVMDVAPAEKVHSYIIMGELDLDGRVFPISGVLPTAINAKWENKGAISSRGNGVEAAWVKNIAISVATTALNQPYFPQEF